MPLINVRIFIIPLLSLVFFSQWSWSKSYSFSELWEKAQAESYEIKKAETELEVSQTQYDRLKMHWAPSLYLKAGYINTDDPGQSFFSNLSQRSIAASDFDPSLLNQPEDTPLGAITVGVALPLYEGGKFSSLKESSFQMLKARESFKKGFSVKTKSQLMNAYSQILSYQWSLEKLEHEIHRINKQINNYKVGRKTNPVGYSGLLGLKATLNRAESYKEYVLAQMIQYKSKVQEIIPELESQWELKKEEPLVFMDQLLTQELGQENENTPQASYFLKGKKDMMSALSAKAQSEKSVLLPSLGLFAESHSYSGDRDSANSVTYGAYLKWNLGWFSYGVLDEARLKAAQSKVETQMAEVKERAQVKSLEQARVSLKNTIQNLEKTQGFLSEQLKISRQLFRSGAINAIQLSELYSNIVDMYFELTKVKSQYIEAQSNYYLLTKNN